MNPVLLTRRQALHRMGLALGGIATAPVLAGVLGGCRTPSGDAATSYAYQTLNENQQRTLAALVDQIIPATDTPGAAEVGVPQFIDKMLAEWYAPEQRDVFLAGLAGVGARAGETAFADLDAEAQSAFVAVLDREAYPANPGEGAAADDDVAEAAQGGTYQAEEEAENEVAGMQGDLGEAQSGATDSTTAGQINTGEGTVSMGQSAQGPPFFVQLKELTLAGYYTSEPGATKELQWMASPGRYDSDVPLSEVGRAWA